MAALDPKANTISFCVDTLVVRERRKLGVPRADEGGYYEMPLAALGIPTRNRTYYDINAFVSQITSSDTGINKMLTDGNLYGEYGHPDVMLLNHEQMLSRLLQIDEKNVSHHIKGIATGDKLEEGGKLVIGKVKPTGPYGKHLQDNINDPCMNTAFSLRSIAASHDAGNLIHREIKKLVTFDAVNAGGYAEASKRFSPSTESFEIKQLDNGMLQLTEAALECMTNTEINEIIGSRHVMVGKQRMTIINGQRTFIDENGNKKSISHELMRLWRN